MTRKITTHKVLGKLDKPPSQTHISFIDTTKYPPHCARRGEANYN